MKAPGPCAKPAVVAVRTQRRVSARSPAGTDRTISKAPGQLGHAYNRLVRRDRKTGALSLRMRISRHPYFVQLREQAGRQRDFRPEREKLLDAIVPLWSAPLTGLPILTLSTSVKWRGSSAKRTAKERDPESDGTAGLPAAAAHDGIRVTGAA
nr:Replication-associated protein [Klebsiella pneumoniae]